MGDRFGYKRILYLSAFVAWLGMFIANFCNTLWLLLLFQVSWCEKHSTAQHG